MTRHATFAAKTARLVVGALCVATLVSGTLAADPPSCPEDNEKEALVAYQEALTTWGAEAASNEEAFWDATREGFYKSTKALVELDSLTPQEQIDYNAQFAGILANYAMREYRDGAFAQKYDELLYATSHAVREFKLNEDDEAARKIAIQYASALFSTRMSAAPNCLSKSAKKRLFDRRRRRYLCAQRSRFRRKRVQNRHDDQDFAPELGEDALDALCEAFEASENPKLVKPIQKTLGQRRYVRCPAPSSALKRCARRRRIHENFQLERI